MITTTFIKTPVDTLLEHYDLLTDTISSCKTLMGCLLKKLEAETADEDIMNLSYLLSDGIEKCYNIAQDIDVTNSFNSLKELQKND